MTIQNFKFADHARAFDNHIGASIPGYNQLRAQCVKISQRFIQDETGVIDIGCSTGRLLRSISAYNQKWHSDVRYIGIDTEAAYQEHWIRNSRKGIQFEVADARTFGGFDNASLAISLFTVQFIREKDKRSLLSKIRNGLVPGGALIIAEKVLANTGRIQDALTFPFYDHKRKTFSAETILDKECRLRGQMTLWTEDEMKAVLREAGFRDLQSFWLNFPFVGLLALK